VTRPPLTYDYRAELEADVAIGLRIAEEARDKRTDLQIASDALGDAAHRLMRQAARPVPCASAYARAQRRYAAACDAYSAALAARRAVA
jgi:hypothetical protein